MPSVISAASHTNMYTSVRAHTSAGMHYTLSGLVRKYARNLHEIIRLVASCFLRIQHSFIPGRIHNCRTDGCVSTGAAAALRNVTLVRMSVTVTLCSQRPSAAIHTWLSPIVKQTKACVWLCCGSVGRSGAHLKNWSWGGGVGGCFLRQVTTLECVSQLF